MARKKKPEEHENLERWLVSYSDFVTLLFATFVVLYALSQTDTSELSKIDEALQKAFSQMSVMQGNDGIMDSSSQNMFDSLNGNSFIQELMAEYISPKYEQKSFDQIEKSIEDLKKDGQLEGVNVEITDRGLLITMDERYLFASGSAELSNGARKLLDKIGALIFEKFVMHCIRVEGHTDCMPISSAKYPSNWELSSARSCTIIRYLINRFKFHPGVFTAVGFADTRPVGLMEGKGNPISSKNRRVEILVLKTKYNALELNANPVLKMTREQQIELQTNRKAIVKQIREENGLSPAAKALMKGEKRKVINMQEYAKKQGIELDNKEIYKSIEQSKKEQKKMTEKIEKQVETQEDLEL